MKIFYPKIKMYEISNISSLSGNLEKQGLVFFLKNILSKNTLFDTYGMIFAEREREREREREHIIYIRYFTEHFPDALTRIPVFLLFFAREQKHLFACCKETFTHH